MKRRRLILSVFKFQGFVHHLLLTLVCSLGKRKPSLAAGQEELESLGDTPAAIHHEM